MAFTFEIGVDVKTSLVAVVSHDAASLLETETGHMCSTGTRTSQKQYGDGDL